MYPIALLRATALLFRMHVSSSLRSRRTLVGIVLAAVPPLLGFLIAKLDPGDVTGAQLFAGLGTFLLVLVVVPLLGVALGVGIIADEAEARTITYPFTRAIPRAALFIGRWLSTTLALVVLVSMSGLLLFGATSLRDSPPSPEEGRALIGAAVFGVVVYSIGAGVIGILTKRGLIVALAYAFAFEIVMSTLPGSTQRMTIQYHMRSMFVDLDADTWAEFEPLQRMEFLEPQTAALKLAIVMGLLLVLGGVTVTRRQFVLSS